MTQTLRTMHYTTVTELILVTTLNTYRTIFIILLDLEDILYF